MSTTTKAADKATTNVKTSTTTKSIKPKDLTIREVIELCRGIENAAFKSDDEDNENWCIKMALADTMAQFLVLYCYFPELSTYTTDYKEFFNDFCKGKYTNYVKALDGSMTYQIIMDFVNKRKEIVMGKLTNPMHDVLSELKALLHNYNDKFNDIEPDDFKKFLSAFEKFSETANTETLTEALLKAKGGK